MQNNFRLNLRFAMRVAGISQRDLAREAQTSNSYVNRVLKGSVSPSIKACQELATAVGCELPELLQAPEIFSSSAVDVGA